MRLFRILYFQFIWFEQFKSFPMAGKKVIDRNCACPESPQNPQKRYFLSKVKRKQNWYTPQSNSANF